MALEDLLNIFGTNNAMATDPFGGGGVGPGGGYDPEALAAAAAQAGIPPPPLSSFRQLAQAPAGASDLGALFEPRPTSSAALPSPIVGGAAPQPTAPAAPLDITPPGAAMLPAAAKNPLLQTLQGIRAPTPPQAPYVGTPAAPRPHGNVKAGQLLALLLANEAGGGGGGLKLPSTLGAALGGR